METVISNEDTVVGNRQAYIVEHILGPNGDAVIEFSSTVEILCVVKVGRIFKVVIKVYPDDKSLYKIHTTYKLELTYIPEKAKFINTVVVGDKLYHFFYQPEGADTEEDKPVKEQKYLSTVKQDRPPKEEEVFKIRDLLRAKKH